MKALILAVVLLSAEAPGQVRDTTDTIPADNSYDLTVRLTGRKGKPVKGTRLMASAGPGTDLLHFPADGVLTIPGVLPGDTLTLVSSRYLFRVALDGVRSISVVFVNPRRIEGYVPDEGGQRADYGYFTVSKRDDTNPTGVVDVRDAGKSRNLLEFLNGRVAGLNVDIQRQTMNIRGISSITQSIEPLVIVDGIQMDVRTANMIVRPSDVESITVDKSGSLYGIRGANGVVIITTRSGPHRPSDIP